MKVLEPSYMVLQWPDSGQDHVEDMTITVKLICDRDVSYALLYQALEHRVLIQEIQQLYLEGSPGLAFVRPRDWEGNSYGHPFPSDSHKLYLRWELAMQAAEEHYLKLLAMGAEPRDANAVLPGSFQVEIIITATARAWRAYLGVCTSAKVHPHVRQLMVPLWENFRERIPGVFEELVTPTVIPGTGDGDVPRCLSCKGRD